MGSLWCLASFVRSYLFFCSRKNVHRFCRRLSAKVASTSSPLPPFFFFFFSHLFAPARSGGRIVAVLPPGGWISNQPGLPLFLPIEFRFD